MACGNVIMAYGVEMTLGANVQNCHNKTGDLEFPLVAYISLNGLSFLTERYSVTHTHHGLTGNVGARST